VAQWLGNDFAAEPRLGYVLLHEDRPPLNFFVSGEWMAYRQNAPIAPQMTVRFGLTIAFPQFKPW
jgi:hypothetical protein